MSTIYNSLTNFGRVRYGKSYFWPTSGAIIRNLEPYYGQTLNSDLYNLILRSLLADLPKSHQDTRAQSFAKIVA
jgi:hypothetical protein